MANWREAAELYRQAQVIVEEEKRDERLNHVAEQLHDFLASDLGAEALELLKASNRYIVFGYKLRVGGSAIMYLLSGHGCCTSNYIDGYVPAHSDVFVPGPILDPIEPYTAVEAALKHGHKDPETFMPWLREELDKIAAAAPEPVAQQRRTLEED
ncbi:MAG: hypothetical protein WC551_01155 [Patescibacteria group bacterium]